MASEQWQDLEGIVRLATWAATLRPAEEIHVVDHGAEHP
jgi:hypothetical protein